MNDKNKSIEEEIIQQLLLKNYTLTAAESCTGGLFLGRLINVPGVSGIIKEGFITYSEEAKMKYVGVLKSTLDEYGVVSEAVAAQMALGAAKRANANIGVGITGIAGPDGGTKEKPVGTVCIGCSINGEVITKQFTFSGSRQEVREQSVDAALDLLRRKVSISS